MSATTGLRWCDSHCHLDYDGVGVEAIEAARAAGVERMVAIGADAGHAAAAVALAGEHPGGWAAVGVHPHNAIDGVAGVVDLLGRDRVVAVGECGLDYHYDHSPRDVQRAVFAEQIALAHQLERALVIHTRDAWDDTFDVLRAEGVPERTVLHCFSGGPEEARRCLELGMHLSFSGIVTFKKADDIRAAAALCPLERMLVETDSPYLAPEPHRGRPNQPALVPVVGARLAEVKGVGVEEVAAATWDNATRVFALEGR